MSGGPPTTPLPSHAGQALPPPGRRGSHAGVRSPGASRRPRTDNLRVHGGAELYEEQDVERLQEHRLDREEVAGDDALGLGGEELTPGRTVPARRPPKTRATKDRPDRRRRDDDPQALKLALDPYAPPAGVLSRHAQDQGPGLRVDGRAPLRRPMPIGPFAPNELPVPPHQRGRDGDHALAVRAHLPGRRIRRRTEVDASLTHVGAPGSSTTRRARLHSNTCSID